MTATFGPARNQNVNTCIGCLTGYQAVVNLCDGGDSGLVRLGDPFPVGTETNRKQRGPRLHRVLEQPWLLAHDPVHQADSELAADMLQLLRERRPGGGAAHADHPQTAGGGNRSGQPPAGDPTHRCVDDGYPQAEGPRPLRG
ncbi:hypothetical protein MSIMFI_03728 [Mycobacterium simulans]|nr:hypothetical protein MSIMFI_03728 [Mycobacterium simulans]